MHRSICVAMLAFVAGHAAPASGQGDAAAPAAPAVAADPLADKVLSLGEQAPPIRNATWLKGEPVTEWVKGQIYILDFWATWCGPCVQAIPHMNEVQEKYKDKGVNVIGVAIWPRKGQRDTKAYVEAGRPAPLNYRVAEDDKGGTSARSFMDSTNSGGIPRVIIVDRDGRFAWIGHPLDGMDEALEQIVAGKYDINKVADEQKAAADKINRSQQLMSEFSRAQMAEEWPKAVEIADQMIAHDPDLFTNAAIYKYVMVLTKLNDRPKAAEVGKMLVDGPLAKNPQALGLLGRVIVDEESIPADARDYKLALAAASRSNELSEGKDANALAALAAVALNDKEYDKAVTHAEKALELVKDQEQIAEVFQARLDECRSARDKAAKGE
jgi:thiol-disulfide isomerase/thioredoxin